MKNYSTFSRLGETLSLQDLEKNAARLEMAEFVGHDLRRKSGN